MRRMARANVFSQSAAMTPSPSSDCCARGAVGDQLREHARRLGERGQVVVARGQPIARGEGRAQRAHAAGDHRLEEHVGRVAGGVHRGEAVLEHPRRHLLQRVAEDDLLTSATSVAGVHCASQAFAHAAERVDLAGLFQAHVLLLALGAPDLLAQVRGVRDARDAEPVEEDAGPDLERLIQFEHKRFHRVARGEPARVDLARELFLERVLADAVGDAADVAADDAGPEEAVDVGGVAPAHGGDGRLAHLVEPGLGLAADVREGEGEAVSLDGVGERGHEAAQAEVLGELHQHLERGAPVVAPGVVGALVELRSAVARAVAELLGEARKAEGDQRHRARHRRGQDAIEIEIDVARREGRRVRRADDDRDLVRRDPARADAREDLLGHEGVARAVEWPAIGRAHQIGVGH